MGSGNIPRVWVRYVDRYASINNPNRPCKVQVLRHSEVSPGYEVLAEFPGHQADLAKAYLKLLEE